MKYRKGDRVRHPSMAAWGLGLVLEDSEGMLVRIFFVEAQEKTLSLTYVQPVVVTGAAAESIALDNLKVVNGAVGIRYKSLNASMDYFLQEFPGGFRGERFIHHERSHKEEIRDQVQKQLGREAMGTLLSAGNYREICDRALKMTGIRANAMIFKNEKMALRDGLASAPSAQRFAEELFNVLHETGDFDVRFNAFAACLQDIGAGKWTNATYFLFFMHPDRHMFVKPTITRNAADICAFYINYRPEINSLSYRCVMDFSTYLEKAIVSLEPRDMIDVQSFMWCIAPGTYSAGDL